MTEHEQQPVGDLADLYTQETWDARYSESGESGQAGGIWSGEPNQRLVEQVADLAPGDALEIGAGEGADAVWLARRGWRVTALDVSVIALGRAVQHAADAGVGDRVSPLHLDLMTFGGSLPGGYDLVSASYMHVPRPRFAEFWNRVGASAQPGTGRLLVVGHHPDDIATGVRRPHGPDLLFTHDDVVGALDPGMWTIEHAESPTREVERDGERVTVRDAVVLAARRTI